jgi:hypothetical protein
MVSENKKLLSLLSLGCLFFSGVFADYTPEALADQVTSLPGAENLDFSFNQFSGYLTIGGSKNMHYWMAESMGDPKNDPIAFWTNGVRFSS